MREMIERPPLSNTNHIHAMNNKEKHEYICSIVEKLATDHKNGLNIPLAELERAFGLPCAHEVAQVLNAISFDKQDPATRSRRLAAAINGIPDPQPLAKPQLPDGCHDLTAFLKWCAQNGVVMDTGRRIQACQELQKWVAPLQAHNPNMTIVVSGIGWDEQTLTVDGIECNDPDNLESLPCDHPLSSTQWHPTQITHWIMAVEREFGNYRRVNIATVPIHVFSPDSLNFTAQGLSNTINKIEKRLVESLGFVRDYAAPSQIPTRALSPVTGHNQSETQHI